MNFAGLFFSRQPLALSGVLDAPYAVLGRHALCARDCASDGGAMACAFGLVRCERDLAERFKREGIRYDSSGGVAALALAAYRRWGERYPEHLEGPVSTVVIDQDAQRMILSRDRMGETSVYYMARGAFVAFADHPAPLMNAPFGARTVDAQGLCELFALGPAHTPGLTPVQGISALKPGCSLVCDGRGQSMCRYFSIEVAPHEEDMEHTVERVRGMIEQALTPLMKLEPGAMLSGGLDSTVLTALASNMAGPMDTWSVGYEQDERYFAQNDYQHERDKPFIERAVKLLGARHCDVELSQADLADSLSAAMEARGMPGMGDVDSSLLLFARRIAPQNRFVLSGECADEVFGGYPWFHRAALIAADGFPWSGSIDLRESVIKRPVREKIKLRAYAAARYHEACAREPRVASDDALQARLRMVHGLCLKWFMPVLQERAACMCGAAGLTVLTPYCDDRLAQYLYNVPWTMKNAGGRAKGLLRDAMRDVLPKDLLERRKSPYPKTHHPQYARLVCDRMNGVLNDRHAPIHAVIDADAVRALMEGGMPAADTPWFGQLMTGAQLIAYLLQVNDFLKTYALEVAL